MCLLYTELGAVFLSLLRVVSIFSCLHFVDKSVDEAEVSSDVSVTSAGIASMTAYVCVCGGGLVLTQIGSDRVNGCDIRQRNNTKHGVVINCFVVVNYD